MANVALKLFAGGPALLFRSHFRVAGDSMTPRLRDGDLLHVIPQALSDSPFPRSAVVVARSSASDGVFWVKRVIGLPGEFVAVDDCGGILVDDVPLCEPYLADSPSHPSPPSAWLCGDDEYFLMGDNRADSSDSRRYGPVHRSAIIGRVWLHWPSRPGWAFRPRRIR
ncbi:MAG: signal peptidase I [Chloroflexi bacterium]|nr:signal peptidase I [Chloroflexota bacterium]MYD47498.1 signal peptidase I [Chloroflexota bacterium]